MILDYKNSSIYYSDIGEGDAVVLLHGFLETSAMWQDFIPQLSKHNRVVCIDLLGHGHTDCIGYIHTMDAMADAVFAVLNHLKIKNAKFIGHSMGGYVALALAEQHAQLFNGLCLMNSTFEADSEERQLIRTRAVTMAYTNFEGLVRMSFSNLFAPESKTRFKDDYTKALNIALATSTQGYIAAQEGMKIRPDRYNSLKRLTGKKLIVTGKKDGLINPKKHQNAH